MTLKLPGWFAQPQAAINLRLTRLEKTLNRSGGLDLVDEPAWRTHSIVSTVEMENFTRDAGRQGR